jgi:transcriptional regulator with XRE-family HTH domain
MFDYTDINKYETFSDFLNDSIKNSNMTKQRLSELLDIHPAKVYRWTRGDNLPKKDAIVKMAHFFNININDLMRLVNNQKKNGKKKKIPKSKTYNSNRIDIKKIKEELSYLYKEKELAEDTLVNILKEIIKKESLIKATKALK